MKIGVDLDGVIADVIPELVLRLKKLDIIANPSDWHSIYIEEHYEQIPDGWARDQFTDPLFFLNAIADESAFYSVNKWFYSNNDIFIVTCRPESLRDITERWLDEWGIPYNDLYMGAVRHKKSDVLLDLGCSVMIEDDGKESDCVAEAGIRSFLRIRPYNKNYRSDKKVEKVSDMYVVYNALMSSESLRKGRQGNGRI